MPSDESSTYDEYDNLREKYQHLTTDPHGAEERLRTWYTPGALPVEQIATHEYQRGGEELVERDIRTVLTTLKETREQLEMVEGELVGSFGERQKLQARAESAERDAQVLREIESMCQRERAGADPRPIHYVVLQWIAKARQEEA